MKGFVADLHIHSHYSRATSPDLNIPTIVQWAAKKGLSLVGTGDFTHPGWRAELARDLEEDGTGLLVPKLEVLKEALDPLPSSLQRPPRFVLQVEVSSIFRKGGRVRKVHTLVFVSSFAAAERFSLALSRLGNVSADGRPILGVEPLHILDLALDADPMAMVIPAHIWTPHFSLFGSESGFDSIEECFEQRTGEIFALETGLSSDIPMNRRWSALDRFSLISCSDAHSPSRLGREATLFDCDLTYHGMRKALRGEGGLLGTVEFFPEEGKYHLDGHRKCGVRLSPEETRSLKGRCPRCNGLVTRGVLGRVEALADRKEPAQGFPGQISLIPLVEVLSEILDSTEKSRKVLQAYEEIIFRNGPEIEILAFAETKGLDCPEVVKVAIERMRQGKVLIEAGYDGEYGRIRVFEKGELEELFGQKALFETNFIWPKEKTPSKPQNETPLQQSLFEAPRDAPGPGLKMTDEQAAAATFFGSPVLVIAGPGTGKTRTLVERALWALRQGHGVLILTFTNRACDEIERRLMEAGQRGDYKVATFHSFALWALNNYRMDQGLPPLTIAEPEKVLAILEDLVGDRERAMEVFEARRKKDLSEEVQPVVANLEERLWASGTSDLDGLVPILVRILLENQREIGNLQRKFDHVIVDEFQDISPDQYELLRLLCPKGEGLFAVGDPDQTIYAFRGSNPKVFDHFVSEWPDTRVFRLTLSHRLPGPICRASSMLMGRDGLVSAKPFGAKVVLYEANSPEDEAAFIAGEIERLMGGLDMVSATLGASMSFGQFAVLSRTNEVCEAVGSRLRKLGLPVATASDRPMWEKGFVKVAMEALEGAHEEAEAAQVIERALSKTGVEGFEKKALLALVSNRKAREALAYLLALREVDAFGIDPERVSCLTMHAAKGLEFDTVFVCDCEDGVVPLLQGSCDLEEERRLLYVAMTRACERLYITYPRHRGIASSRPSRFLKAILREVERVHPVKVFQQSLF